MARNKKSKSDQPSEEELLVQRVDAMMDTRQPDPAAVAPALPAAKPEAPINIFEKVGTAPEVAADLLKKIGIKENPAPASERPATESASEHTIVPVTVKKVEKTAELPAPEPTPPEEPAPDTAAADEEATPLDNPETDKAVDDIAAHEADELLAVQDAATEQSSEPPTAKRDWRARLGKIFRSKWLWLIVPIVIIALFAVPYTRYKLLGLVVKRTVDVTVMDSQTGTPVSGAIVSMHGVNSKTNAEGVAKLKAAPGPESLQVKKQYYRSYSGQQFVRLRGTANLKVRLVATGRLVPLTVINKISGKPLAGAEIAVLDTTATTNSQGKTFVVLPATAMSDKATVSASGFNLAQVSVTVSATAVPGNTFSLTPSGTVYFLSNASGNIDVVKSDLDGANRQTVLAGTGHEDPNSTSLLASRDWRYLVLEAHRDAPQAGLYLIDGKTNKLTKIDTSNSSFQLVGWYGHFFIYDSVSNGASRWQASRETLKSYDADHDALTTLDQNQATGSADSYAYQSFNNFYLLDNLVAYSTQWYAFGSASVSGKSDSLRGVTPDNQNKKDYQTFDAASTTLSQFALNKPQKLYFSTFSTSSNNFAYYQFDGQTVSQPGGIDQNTFAQPYPTYLLSPSGKQTFWSELRDGKNSLFLGDATANNQKPLASSGDYAPYGWFSDNYVLVSKNGSELYIMPTSGLATGHSPLKVTDYYKPAQAFPGYGYGYGGL